MDARLWKDGEGQQSGPDALTLCLLCIDINTALTTVCAHVNLE